MAGMVRAGTNFDRVGRAVGMSGLDSVITKLVLFSKRLEDVPGAMQEIYQEFAFMEELRFASGGSAPEFGISGKWAYLSFSTQYNRQSNGAPTTNEPLVAHGWLREAATHPTLRTFGAKGMEMLIDPSKIAPADYSHGKNYGWFHQNGPQGNNPARKFVSLAGFIPIATLILKNFITRGVDGFSRAEVPSDRSINMTGISDLKSMNKLSQENQDKLFAKWMKNVEPNVSQEQHLLKIADARAYKGGPLTKTSLEKGDVTKYRDLYAQFSRGDPHLRKP